MTVLWHLVSILTLVSVSESKCSPTSYYRNCWIRRFPGLFIDVEESQRRGAQLLKTYQEETALKCSRMCCLTRNFSCNLAVFHYNTSQESVNCLHLHCPSLESCTLMHRGDVILYNVSKGVDPDLLVFGKYLGSSLRLWPPLTSSRLNASEPFASDKRQFNRPAGPPALTVTPTKKHAPPQSSTPSALAHTISTAGRGAPTIALNPPPDVQSTTGPPGGGVRNTTTRKPLTAAHPPVPSHYPPVPCATATGRHTPSLTALAGIGGGKPYPNDTKGSVSRNDTTKQEPQPGGAPPPPAWRLAANTVLVVLATVATVLLSCCCWMLLCVSCRGRWRRKGCYHIGPCSNTRLLRYATLRQSP